jgi:hypothetical protein
MLFSIAEDRAVPRAHAPRVTLRLQCCRCGAVQRFTPLARAAWQFADELLHRPCGARVPGRPEQCDSRDRRLELRPLTA